MSEPGTLEAGMPLAVLTEIGGCTAVAKIGRRAVIIGETFGPGPGAEIVQIADRVGQTPGVMVVAVVMVGAVVMPRLRCARQPGEPDDKGGCYPKP